jgi:hypothetical protein
MVQDTAAPNCLASSRFLAKQARPQYEAGNSITLSRDARQKGRTTQKAL